MGGYAISALAGDHATAGSIIGRALTLNPNSAHAWMAKGLVSCFLNRPGAAIEAFERAMRLSPLDPLGHVFTWGLALAHFIAGRYEQSLEWAEVSARDQPRYIPPLRHRVVLYAHFGRLEEAKELLQRVFDLTPGLTIAKFKAHQRFLSPEILAPYLEDLRKAGLPEGERC